MRTRTTGLELWNTASLIACVVLLGFLIWRIDVMDSSMRARAELSGQWIESGGVRTERYLDESKEHWRERHYEAIRAFEQEGR